MDYFFEVNGSGKGAVPLPFPRQPTKVILIADYFLCVSFVSRQVGLYLDQVYPATASTVQFFFFYVAIFRVQCPTLYFYVG